MRSDNDISRGKITNRLLQAVNVLVFPEYGLTGLVDRSFSREELKALIKGMVHACIFTLISLAFLDANFRRISRAVSVELRQRTKCTSS